jgi:hypothetical protein
MTPLARVTCGLALAVTIIAVASAVACGMAVDRMLGRWP